MMLRWIVLFSTLLGQAIKGQVNIDCKSFFFINLFINEFINHLNLTELLFYPLNFDFLHNFADGINEYTRCLF